MDFKAQAFRLSIELLELCTEGPTMRDQGALSKP
jgi:hypothetical protein